MDINKYLEQKRSIVDRALLEYLPQPKGLSAELARAMRYSVQVGGKRVRSILMLAIAEMLGEPAKRVLEAACAAEYIHTSTLILDDLPCMDDSALRRGSLSLHRKFDQATAILASYSLVALAFKLLVENAHRVSRDSRLAFEAAKIMSKAIGVDGLCAGQYADLKTGPKKINIDKLMYIHSHKTADLFMAGCEVAGCLSAAGRGQLAALGRYGKYMGLAFQAYDDMLSIKKTDKQLGKDTRKDKYSPNLVNLFGLKKANDKISRYVRQAKAGLAIFGKKADRLGGILEYVIHREK